MAAEATEREPDWEQYGLVLRKMEALQAAGGWDREGYLRIREEALEALGSAPECIEAIDNRAEPDWVPEAEENEP